MQRGEKWRCCQDRKLLLLLLFFFFKAANELKTRRSILCEKWIREICVCVCVNEVEKADSHSFLIFNLEEEKKMK